MPETGTETRRAFRGPRWALALLRVPLVAKVAGANLLIVAVAFVAALMVRGGTRAGRDVLFIAGLALLGSFLVNVALIVLALRPLQALETLAARVWGGHLDVRVHESPLADARIARVGRTMNLLLDGLLADRMRTRQLAAEVIGAGDRERAYIARELHDSVAQSLAALVMRRVTARIRVWRSVSIPSGHLAPMRSRRSACLRTRCTHAYWMIWDWSPRSRIWHGSPRTPRPGHR